MPLRRPLAAAAALMAALAAAPAAPAATLEGRALLPADASFPAPFAGVANADPAPAPGARQPVGGFSALLRVPGRDTYLAMPDNGFGSKANSRSFLLRAYRVRADLETARGGAGTVEVLDAITLRDPDGHVPFPIVLEGTQDRLLTGGDFDPESLRVARDGTLWFGEEFGPFLLHTDATGRLLEPPVPTPGVRSPDNPLPGPTANLGRSNGFEAMAASPSGTRLYPVLEGPVAGDERTVRRVLEFDTVRGTWTGRRWTYRVGDPAHLVSDLTALGGERFVALERDNGEGTAARHTKAFVTRIDRPGGELARREVADLLRIADPSRISLPAREGDLGIGDPFAMPYVTIEAVQPLGDDRLVIVNDTNFGSRGRNPGRPDDSDLVVVRVPGLDAPRGDHDGDDERRGTTAAVIGDTPYGAAQRAAFPALVDAVDADPEVRSVLHLGDVKAGSDTCDDARFADLRGLFDTFDDPFVLTPGDNDWTDCHRASNGGFDPLERLAKVREVFFDRAGRTIGGRAAKVESQAARGYVENVRYAAGGALVVTVHAVGSLDDGQPWFGAAETPEQRARREAERDDRRAANLEWLEASFAEAERTGARGVVVAMQADTVAGGGRSFESLNAKLAQLAERFDGPVLLLQGDTHRYLTDQPLPNVTRVVVEGEVATEWLRLTIDPDVPGLFSWTREAVGAPAAG